MDRDCCSKCVWAKKREFDTAMRYCYHVHSEIYGESVPCVNYERYDDTF